MRHGGTYDNFWGALLMWAMRNNRVAGSHVETPPRETPRPTSATMPDLRRAA